MPTPAGLLIAGSTIPSGTPAQHLLNLGGGVVTTVVCPLEGQLVTAESMVGALHDPVLLSGALTGDEALTGVLNTPLGLQGTITDSGLTGTIIVCEPDFQRTAFPYQENVELWIDADFPEPGTDLPIDRGPNQFGVWPWFSDPLASSWVAPSTELGLPGYWAGDNGYYFTKSLAGHPNAKLVPGPCSMIFLHQPRRNTYNYGADFTGNPRLKYSTLGNGWSHGETNAASGVYPASFGGVHAEGLGKWALLCYDHDVDGPGTNTDRIRVLNHGGAVGPTGDFVGDYRLNNTVIFGGWLAWGPMSHIICVNTIPDSTVLYNWFLTNYPHLFDNDVL